MAKVAVFDSGLGSLSVIRAIQAATYSDVVYFADRQNFPYGSKSKSELGGIIGDTIAMLQDRFAPDLIVMASNTPSLVLGCAPGVVGVYPPARAAAQASSTKSIAILGTAAAVNSEELGRYIAEQGLPDDIMVCRLDASRLVGLVESGTFLKDARLCRQAVRDTLGGAIKRHSIDAATLSSTHLPFMRRHLESEFPEVKFFDPAECVAAEVAARTAPSERNSLQVYASGDAKEFEQNLAKVGLECSVERLTV